MRLGDQKSRSHTQVAAVALDAVCGCASRCELASYPRHRLSLRRHTGIEVGFQLVNQQLLLHRRHGATVSAGNALADRGAAPPFVT